jgi:hypothetical protein
VTPSISQLNITTALRSFLLAVLPAGTSIIVAQDNRVPEPQEGSFVVLTPLRMIRLRTNVHTFQDVKFTGSITANVLTVSAVATGTIVLGATVFGVGVANGTTVIAQISGTPGGIGTYQVAGPAQSIGLETLSAGLESIEQGTRMEMQLDFHGADSLSAGDMAQTVSTLMRDEFATTQFANQVPNFGVVPLYADDPRQAPFINAEQQYETRWVVEAMLQFNGVIEVPLEFADSAVVTAVSVEATFPP